MKAQDLIGKKVANDGRGLREALAAHYQIASLKHIGNFVFRAELADGQALLVNTQPVDLAMRTIRIVEIIGKEGGGKHE